MFKYCNGWEASKYKQQAHTAQSLHDDLLMVRTWAERMTKMMKVTKDIGPSSQAPHDLPPSFMTSPS